MAILIFLVGAGLILLNRKRYLSPATEILATLALVGLTLNFFGVGNWLLEKNNGVLILEDANASRFGLLLNEATRPDVTIACVWAGTAPYFAGREAIDLLGKSDPVIAKGRPVAEFLPGHNKWNYVYSIGKLKPDLVFGLWHPTEADRQMMTNLGYIEVQKDFYVNKKSLTKVNLNRF